MSTAAEKNIHAFKQIGLNPELIGCLNRFRIGIFSDEKSAHRSGRLTAEALGDVLGRLWRFLEATGPIAEDFVVAANVAAASCKENACASVTWLPPYDVVVAIGSEIPGGGSANVIQVGASGWEVMVGGSAYVNEDQNPVGPAAAASIVAAEIFRIAFADSLGERMRRLPISYQWSTYPSHEKPPNGTLVLPKVPVLGVGAVTHGLLWVLERWPHELKGQIDLVDPDPYSVSNGQRYAGMHPEDLGRYKVEQARGRIRRHHPELAVEAFQKASNGYFDDDRSDHLTSLAVVGVDSKEQRRQIGLKLPRRVVNMWTEGAMLGVGRHGIGDGWPCLHCIYPEDSSGALDEVGQISQETGIAPVRVRELLDTNGLLEEQDVSLIATRIAGIDPPVLVGKPLRSARSQLCAMGRVQLGASSDTDVPFAFVSFLSGVMGFVELIRELSGLGEPFGWQANGLKYPQSGSWTAVSAKPECYLCGDEIARSLVRQRYG